MNRDTRTAYRSRAKATERLVDNAAAEMKAFWDEKFAATKAAAMIANAAVPFTEDEYKAASAVRTRTGWYRVVKVNAKSVAVATSYSWNDRVLRSAILEVR